MQSGGRIGYLIRNYYGSFSESQHSTLYTLRPINQKFFMVVINLFFDTVVYFASAAAFCLLFQPFIIFINLPKQ